MRAVGQLLDLVRRELSAQDAYVQLGGGPLADPNLLACTLQPNVRLVARFADPPQNRQEVEHRLKSLAEAFTQTVNESLTQVSDDIGVGHGVDPAARRTLADALTTLAAGARASVALVIDVRSPIVWGTSDSGLQLPDVTVALELADDHDRARAAGIDPRATEPAPTPPEDALAQAVARLRERFDDNPAAARRDLVAARAIAWARTPGRAAGVSHEPDLGVHMRHFSGIYRLVLGFDGPFSDLVADPITRRALPVIERLVAELPPLEPPPEGGRVVMLRPR